MKNAINPVLLSGWKNPFAGYRSTIAWSGYHLSKGDHCIWQCSNPINPIGDAFIVAFSDNGVRNGCWRLPFPQNVKHE